MRYELDTSGYINTVAFGCRTNNCLEYTGTVPIGYNNLVDWATYAEINAYYIDSDGNLALDSDKLKYLEELEEKQAKSNSYIIRKEIFKNEDMEGAGYEKKTIYGDEVIVIEDALPLSATVDVAMPDNISYVNNMVLFVQGKNMMPCTAKNETISGVSFTRNFDGSISASGTATADIEYTVSEITDGTPSFVLKSGLDYYLNLCGFDCELRYYDGETTSQQYVGASGLLNFANDIKVSQVIMKIPSGTVAGIYFFPQLEFGSVFTSYEEHKSKKLKIDLTKVDTLYAKDTMYVREDLYVRNSISYSWIYINNGDIYTFVNGKYIPLGSGYIGTHTGYNIIYTSEGSDLKEDMHDICVKYISDTPLEEIEADIHKNTFGVVDYYSMEAHNGDFSGSVKARKISANDLTVSKNSSMIGDLSVGGDFSVAGAKSRTVKTDNYGERLLYCYETPSPMFGDLGEGQLDDTGKCYVFIDDIFGETVDADCEYQVFLQAYGEGKCYVKERTNSYFVVQGTANMRFGWELKAIQKDYNTVRLEGGI